MEKTLGKRISAMRKRAGLTQDKLAERLGVTAQAVSKWENDLSCPDITMLPKLAQLFGVTTDELLGIAPAETVHEAEIVEEEPDIHFTAGDNNSGWEFSWDAGRKNHLSMALWVLTTGVCLLLSHIYDLDAGFWELLWPSALLIFGLSATIPHFSIWGIACAIFGGQRLLQNLGITTYIIGWDFIFPAILVLLGLHLVLKSLKKPKGHRFHIHRNGIRGHNADTEFHTDDESFTCTTAFNDVSRTPQLKRLRYGSATLAFGDMTLDLTQCQRFAPDAKVDLSCGFGDLTMLVPKNCQVKLSSSNAFGDVEIKGDPNPDAEYLLLADCSVGFGDITIRYV